MADLSQPKPKGEYYKSIKVQKVVNTVYDIVTKDNHGSSIEERKGSIGFLEHVCCLVETYCKKHYKADKKDIVFKVLMKLFPLNEPEKKKLSADIDHLHARGLIKTISMSKKFVRLALSLVKKKVM